MLYILNIFHFFNNIIVNNYEISEWQFKYLTIWSSRSEYPFITTDMLFNYLGIQRLDIVDLYFSVYEHRISASNFISLICTFTFFTLEQILQVLLSICGIHSNCYINQEQIYTFLSALNVEVISLKLTEKWLSTIGETRHSKKPKRISLKSFLKFLLDNPTVINTLFYFKACLIDRIITDHTYKIITQRKNYYNSFTENDENKNNNNNNNNQNNESKMRINMHRSNSRIRNTYSNSNNNLNYKRKHIASPPPSEPYCQKIFRIIFTNEPDPFYSEYIPISYVNSNNNNSYDTIIYLLRCKYGYSKRLTGVANSIRNTTTTTTTNTESTNSEDFVVVKNNRTKHSLNSRKSGLFKSPNYTPRSLMHASKDENIVSPKMTLQSLPGAVNNYISLSSSQFVRKGMSTKISTYSKTIQENVSQN